MTLLSLEQQAIRRSDVALAVALRKYEGESGNPLLQDAERRKRLVEEGATIAQLPLALSLCDVLHPATNVLVADAERRAKAAAAEQRRACA